jgi:hypothetical protein
MKTNKIKIIIFSALTLMFGQMILIQSAPPASAANGLWEQQTGLGDGESEIGDAFGETGAPKDVRVIVANIVKVVLGFVGIILVIIIISAGYKWMTAAGNEENITEAKEALTRAAIGLLIILMAWGITGFVTDCLFKATGGTTSIWYCPEINN